MIEVSAGVIYHEDGRILICRRGEGRRNAHLWEFPGGKREAGESAEACLVRELQEELHLQVADVGFLCALEEGGIRFNFLTARAQGTPVPTEHEDVRFVEPREMTSYAFCPADVPVARRLALQRVRHVVWDFDGTLMDSYPAMVRAFVAAAADYGVAITPERTLQLMKNCLHHCLTTVSAESGVPAETLRRAFRQHEAAELRRGLPPMPGVPETLKVLHAAGIRHHVATHRDLVCRELLEQAGLLPFFSSFVTEEDHLPRKPAPDMLLRLMQRQGLRPEECLMAGDRPLDTEAGLAAGMAAVLIDPEARFPGAACDLHIRQATELIPLLGDPEGE